MASGGALSYQLGGSIAPRFVAPPRAQRRRFLDSSRLILAFRYEQSDPDRFYRQLAADTVTLVGEFFALPGSRVVDVGCGPGDLAEAFRDVGADAVAIDCDFEEMNCRKRSLDMAVLGDGMRMPFADGSFDVVCSSNVMEHVPDAVAMLVEMGRIVRPGGLVFVNYTAWLSPWGGHETSPWHYLGGRRALAHYERVHGRPPKNYFGRSMFALKVGGFLSDVRRVQGLDLVDAFPRYLPRWTRPLVRIPGLREFATWNLAVVLRRPA